MGKTVFGKVMWVGRATVFLVGLAVILALVFGVAVTALAGTGVGAPFNLGKINSVNAISTLSGSVGNGPMLRLDNNSATGGATALNLQVEPGKQPMSVNSQTKVTNLNSDQLDGKDSGEFLPNNIYHLSSDTEPGVANGRRFTAMYCDTGDTLLSGGYQFQNPSRGSEVTQDLEWFDSYTFEWYSDGTPDSVVLFVRCLDRGTPHQP